MSSNTKQQETAEEIELRMKIISEALAEASTSGSQTFSGFSQQQMESLVDPQEGLICDGCE